MKFYSKIIGYTVVMIGVLVCGIMFPFENDANSKDLSTHGQVWEIKEQNIVSYIKSQLTEDKVEKIQKDFILKSKKHINRPKPVGGITKTIEAKVHYYNPEITLTKDIVDQTGKVLYTKVNPLNHQPFTRQLLFIDGDDMKQVMFAVLKNKKIGDDLKIVLISGITFAYVHVSIVSVLLPLCKSSNKPSLISKGNYAHVRLQLHIFLCY